MIEKMKRFFATHISLTQSEGDIEDKLKVASAALLYWVWETAHRVCQPYGIFE
ncbi:hypothetical protein [Methyloglobulus sp.]|uniref:hypothetical protein n=1 Tax=Methyloglobulus sp. TaxID=2518622 RepID=UPI0032B750F8